MDEITTKIIAVLTRKPYQSAREISKSIGLLRKDVNSRLYSHLDELFKKEGADPPIWHLIDQHPLKNSSSTQNIIDNLRTPSEVMQDSGLEKKRHLNDEELTSLAARLLGSSEILFRANGIRVEVSLAERSLSDPYFEFEMIDAESMQVVINTTAVPKSLLKDKEYLYGHLVHCVADAFIFRNIEGSTAQLDRDDLYHFKNQVLLQLGFDPSKDPLI
jgi:hypothetical protein